jgi:small subunit ribosomal protein S24e
MLLSTSQHGFAEKKTTSRKQIKESKNRQLKVRGTGKSIAKHKAKRAAAE